MAIIDQFSNFGYNFIIQNKKSETILGNLKKFINILGSPIVYILTMGENFGINYLKIIAN